MPSKDEMIDGGLNTIPETVELTRVSRTTLYALMDRGELAYMKIGKRRLIPKIAVRDLMKRGLVAAVAV